MSPLKNGDTRLVATSDWIDFSGKSYEERYFNIAFGTNHQYNYCYLKDGKFHIGEGGLTIPFKRVRRIQEVKKQVWHDGDWENEK